MKLKMSNKVVINVIPVVTTIALAFFVNWFFLPAWNLRSEGFWWYLLIVAVIAIASYKLSIFFSSSTIENEKITRILFCIICSIGVILLIGYATSSTIFNAKSFSNLVEIKEGNFENEIQSLSTEEEAEEFSILDIESAQKIGNRSLSEIEKVSQYNVNGEYNLISYKGKEYRVSPLEYASFINAMTNETIPGYVLVDLETQESKLVELEEQIKYAPSDIFSQNLKRHLRNNYPSYIFDKFQFDIDDTGEAYYIVPVLEPRIGLFGGKVVKSFIVVNANSGECKEYLPEDLPEWVDHAYSLDYLMGLAEKYYKYKGGFLNSMFTKSDVKEISYSFRGNSVNDEDEEDKNEFLGYNSIMTKDGVQFFTCVVSASNDESAIGFILANAKTGEITYYDCIGAEESTAQLQAESLYQNYGYESSYPLIVNVDGEPTYVVTLKDKSKINKAYVLINIKNYTISASGEDLPTALLNYKNKIFGYKGLNPSDYTYNDDLKKETKTTTGTISELYQATQNGTTQFFFVLEGDDNLYVSSISNNSRQVQMSKGTKVSIEYYMSENEKLVAIVSTIKIQ